jgi:hypothetical protein
VKMYWREGWILAEIWTMHTVKQAHHEPGDA